MVKATQEGPVIDQGRMGSTGEMHRAFGAWKQATRLSSGLVMEVSWRHRPQMAQSQENPAERAGICIADLSEIETGTMDRSISTITRMADALKLMLDDLVCSWT